MTRILVLGDTHGNINAVQGAVVAAKDHGADRILQVGDFGLWPGVGGMEFLDATNALLRANKMDLYAVGGNHEWWPEWDRITKDNKFHKHLAYGYARSNIKLFPKVAYWTWDKKEFAVAGGAVSIDRQWRTEGESWWPGEELHPSAAQHFTDRKIDYLFTHDCSDKTPWGFQLVPDRKSKAHRGLIDTVLDRCTPAFHFHGHMHRKYEWQRAAQRDGELVWTQTFGLDRDGTRYNMMLLDTETDTAAWVDKGPTWE